MAEKMPESTRGITINSCGWIPFPRYKIVDAPVKVSTGETTNPLVLASFQGARHGASMKRVLFYGHVPDNVPEAQYSD